MKWIFAVAVLAASCAGASAQDDRALPPLVERAIAAGTEAPEEAHWQFTMVADMGEHGQFTARFDSTRPETERWTLIEPASPDLMSDDLRQTWENTSEPDDDAAEDEADSEDGNSRTFSVGGGGSGLFFGAGSTDFIAGGVREIRNTPNQIIYAFDPDLADDDEDDAMARTLGENLRGELTVARRDPFVERLRIHAPASFKPNFMVRIHAFEMELDFERRDGLPAPVMTRFLTRVEASAMMQRVNQFVEFRFSDIVYTAP